jgi:acetyl-CoA carboxylase biotin carboxyl carrier protein
MSLSPQDIQDILRLIDATEYQELHLQNERFALHLRRQPDGQWTQTQQVRTEANWTALTPPGNAAAKPTSITPSTPSVAGLIDVVAPLLGTFYVAPKPGAPAFVEVGTPVDETTVVGLIETMKLMNSVFAGVRGVVAEVCLGDATFAEQGTVLVSVKPDTAA